MFRNLCITLLAFAAFVFPVQTAHAETPGRADILLLQDDLMALWSLELTRSAPKDEQTLCRDALFFLLLAEGSACGLDRDDYPEAFTGMPPNYRGYVARKTVEEAAEIIFGQTLRRHISPQGTTFDGNGYFLDFGTLSDKTGNLCNVSSDTLLPGFAIVEKIEPVKDGSMRVSGMLRRFKEVDGEEILWQAATFHAVIQKNGAKWLLKSFLLEEQAMG